MGPLGSFENFEKSEIVSFNSFSLNVVLESLKFWIKGVIRKHSTQPPHCLIKPSTARFVDFPYRGERQKLPKLWLQPGASKYHISPLLTLLCGVLQRPQVLGNSCRKLQDCCTLALFSLLGQIMFPVWGRTPHNCI